MKITRTLFSLLFKGLCVYGLGVAVVLIAILGQPAEIVSLWLGFFITFILIPLTQVYIGCNVYRMYKRRDINVLTWFIVEMVFMVVVPLVFGLALRYIIGYVENLDGFFWFG